MRRWIEGATYGRQGDHHVGHWPTFLVYFFTDEKLLTVAPVWAYLIYAAVETKKRDIYTSHLLYMHPTFNKFTVVPTPGLDAVLKLGCIKLIFVEFGAEIKRECCWDVLLMQKLLLSDACDLLAKQCSRTTHCCCKACVPWDNVVHRFRHMASQQSWSKVRGSPYLGCGTGTCVSGTSLGCGQVAEAAFWELRLGLNSSRPRWIMGLVGGEITWSVCQQKDGRFKQFLWRCVWNLICYIMTKQLAI